MVLVMLRRPFLARLSYLQDGSMSCALKIGRPSCLLNYAGRSTMQEFKHGTIAKCLTFKFNGIKELVAVLSMVHPKVDD